MKTSRSTVLLLAGALAVAPSVAFSADDAHWYASVNAGGNFMPDQSLSSTGAGPGQTGEVDLGAGFSSGAAVGRAFNRNLRAEAEFLYQSTNHDGSRLNNGVSLPDGNFASTAFALNGIYSFNLFGRETVRSYVGVGVARLTEVDIDFEQGGREMSYSGDDWAVQFLLGARYELGKHWFLDAGLRHLNAGEVTMEGEGATVGRVRADYQPWSATLGVGIRF